MQATTPPPHVRMPLPACCVLGLGGECFERAKRAFLGSIDDIQISPWRWLPVRGSSAGARAAPVGPMRHRGTRGAREVLSCVRSEGRDQRPGAKNSSSDRRLAPGPAAGGRPVCA